MIVDIDLLTVEEEICGDRFRYLHKLNLNVESDAKIFHQIECESEINSLLKKYGYIGI